MSKYKAIHGEDASSLWPLHQDLWPPPCDFWKLEWTWTKPACCYSSLVLWRQVLWRRILFCTRCPDSTSYILDFHFNFTLKKRQACVGGREKSAFVKSLIQESFLLYSKFILLECKHFSSGSGFYRPHSLKADAYWQRFCSFLLLKFHVLLPAICNILYEFCLSVNATCRTRFTYLFLAAWT